MVRYCHLLKFSFYFQHDTLVVFLSPEHSSVSFASSSSFPLPLRVGVLWGQFSQLFISLLWWFYPILWLICFLYIDDSYIYTTSPDFVPSLQIGISNDTVTISTGRSNWHPKLKVSKPGFQVFPLHLLLFSLPHPLFQNKSLDITSLVVLTCPVLTCPTFLIIVHSKHNRIPPLLTTSTCTIQCQIINTSLLDSCNGLLADFHASSLVPNNPISPNWLVR